MTQTGSHTRRIAGCLLTFCMLAASGGTGFAQTSPASSAAAGAQSAQASGLFTTDQATRGQASYEHSCISCHGEHLDDGDFGGPPLRGSYFRGHWGAGSVAGLYGFTKSQMPPDNPGGLSDGTYADIVAYILQVNGYKAGGAELPTDAKAQAALKLAQ